MIRACSRSRLRNPAIGSGSAFNPLSLFTAGEQGLWFDPSDLTSMFQDDAGTIPVTTAGQVVGLIRDKSGNGHDASQATEANKPILRTGSGLWWLEFDGVDDFLVTGNVNLSATPRIGLFSAVNKLSDAASATVIEQSATPGAVPSFSLFAPSAAGVNKFGFRHRGASAQALALTTDTAFNAPFKGVITGGSDLSAPSVELRVNGLTLSTITTATGGGNYSNLPIYVGRTGGTSLPFNGLIYGLILRGVTSNALTIMSTEGYMAGKAGVTL